MKLQTRPPKDRKPKAKKQKPPKKDETQEKYQNQNLLTPHPHTITKPPRTIIHLRPIFHTSDQKYFTIDVVLRTIIHGYLSPFSSQRASLLIFSLQFACIGKKGFFKRVKMNIEFEDMPPSHSHSHPQKHKKPARPAILAYAPFETEERMQEKEVEFERTQGMAAELNVGVNVLGGQGGVRVIAGNETVRTSTDSYFSRGSAGLLTSSSPHLRRPKSTRTNTTSTTTSSSDNLPSIIWYNLLSSTDPHSGDVPSLPSNHRFAILLTRSSPAPFLIHLQLHVDMADMGLRHLLRGTRKFEVQGEAPGLIIDPRTRYEGVRPGEGVSRMNLGKLRREGELAKLVTVG